MKLRKNSNKIFLTGFMGSGKSTVGKYLAESLSYPFFDLDDYIVKQTHKSINSVFAELGEDYFREIESAGLKELAEQHQAFVLATGGGAVIKKSNRLYMRQQGIVVFLYADLDVIYERIKDNHDRPLLNTADPYGELQKLWQARESFYADSDIQIDVSDLSAETAVKKIKNDLGFL